MSETRFLDVRWLDPPEPFERIVAALELLPTGETLHVIIHREPRPLFLWLEREGYRFRHDYNPAGHFEIFITAGSNAADAQSATKNQERD